MTKKPSPKRSGSLQALRLALALTCLNWLAPPSNALAGPVSDRVKISQTVRVCIWPDYYGVSLRNPRNQQYEGIDIDLSGAFAKDLGVKLEYVDSSFTNAPAITRLYAPLHAKRYLRRHNAQQPQH
jgi:ABC-type amino acid transport substrate-binding protein